MEQVLVPLPGAVASYSAKSALFTAGLADRGAFFDNTGSYTISFAAAATLGAGWSCWVRCVSGTQTLDPNSTELINGASTYAVSNAGDIVLVECTGTAFVVSHTQRPSTVAITGGTIDGTTIGATTATTGAFTTISATDAVTLTSASSGLVIAKTTTTTLDIRSTDDASVLTVGGYRSTRSAGSGTIIHGFVGAESTARVNINASGTLTWGSGSATRDCTLSRTAAGTLRFEGEDSGTTNALNVFTIGHNTSGTPANGIGVAIALATETSTTANTTIARLIAAWSDVTHSSRTSSLTLEVVASGSAVTSAQFDRSGTATHTGLLLWDADNATVERVTVGAADSGGSGFKVLRIAN